MKAQLNLPVSVTICEKTLREGLGSEEKFVHTQAKIFLANALVDSGFRNLEMSSFDTEFSPDTPQFRDINDLLKEFSHRDGVSRYCLAQDRKAVGLAIKAKEQGYGPDWISITIDPKPDSPVAKFQGRTQAESILFVEDTIKSVSVKNINVCVVITPSWEKPLDSGPALELVNQLTKAGVRRIIHADPDGEATPIDTYLYCNKMLQLYPDVEHCLHFHDHRGFGIANYLAAMEVGLTRFDTCLGGIGGFLAAFIDGVPTPTPGMDNYQVQPGRKTGLVCTEDFVVMCSAMGVNTGIDIDKMLNTGKWLERIINRRLWSFTLPWGKI